MRAAMLPGASRVTESLLRRLCFPTGMITSRLGCFTRLVAKSGGVLRLCLPPGTISGPRALSLIDSAHGLLRFKVGWITSIPGPPTCRSDWPHSPILMMQTLNLSVRTYPLPLEPEQFCWSKQLPARGDQMLATSPRWLHRYGGWPTRTPTSTKTRSPQRLST